jgi:hypothetical protein
MNHTGVRSTGSRRMARISRDVVSDVVLAAGALITAHPATGRPAPLGRYLDVPGRMGRR